MQEFHAALMFATFRNRAFLSSLSYTRLADVSLGVFTDRVLTPQIRNLGTGQRLLSAGSVCHVKTLIRSTFDKELA